MKVLFITNMYPTPDHIYNGIHIKEQIEYLTQKFPISYDIEFINGRKSKLNYLRSIFNIRKLIRSKNYDLIHIHFGLSGLFLLFNQYKKIPKVVTLHGSDTISTKAYGLMLTITKLVVKKVNRVILVNDKMQEKFLEFNDKLVSIPCGINLNTFDIPRRNNDTKFLIGFPGDKNRPGKNFLLFKNIISLLTDSGLKIEYVEFHNLSREQVIENLSTLDCLLLTSLYEGSPQVIKEAMVAGVPIVTTNVGDVKKLLKGLDNCYVIDSFNAIEFIPSIKKILAINYKHRVTKGKNRIIKLNFDQDTIVDRVFNVYKQIIAEHEKEI